MQSIRLGRSDITTVEEITFKMPLSSVTSDEALIARHADLLGATFMDSDGNWDMVCRSWILVIDDRVVVVDPCTGNGRDFPAFSIMHMLNTPYIERFAATGIRPEDVDYVFCTHLHMDHCGWNTELRGGRYVPTFPNARYIMVQREYDRWDPGKPGYRHVPQNAGVFENSVFPVVEAGLAQLVPDTFQMLPSLLVEPAHGHTLGHSMLHLASHGREAYFVGDTFHHPLEVMYPELDAGTCEDWDSTLQTRRRIIDACLAKNALLIPAHFGCPFGGTVKREEGMVLFEPYAGATEGRTGRAEEAA